jgi:hypothetical protein
MHSEKTMMTIRPLPNCDACDCVLVSAGFCCCWPSWAGISWSEEADEVGDVGSG